MSETANYGLYVTDDNSERFYDWRTKMNGITDSNMQKIDAALGTKADASVCVDRVLYASSWHGDSSPYTQEILIDGLTASQNGSISVSTNATDEEWNSAIDAKLRVVEQKEGSLVVSSDGEKPTIDIHVSIIIIG